MRINDEQRKVLAELATDHGLRFIALFGSQADGGARENSDYDIAIMSKLPRPLYNDLGRFGQILSRLSAILQIAETKLDLTDLHNEDILHRYQIVLNGKLLAGDEDDYENFRAFVIREYQGASALRELETAVINRRQELLAKALAQPRARRV